MAHKLYPDQALVSVLDKSTTNENIDIFYQTEECFGCPLQKLTKLKVSNSTDFVINTKYNCQLELRGLESNHKLCRFDNLQLDSQAKYELVYPNNDSWRDCHLTTNTKGECLLCPVAFILCVIIIVTLGEKVYLRIKARRCRQPAIDSIEPRVEVDSTVNNDIAEEDQTSERLASTTGTPTRRTRARVESLDMFRGVTITAMILVNNGGAGYSILEHKPWDGISLADLVFPFFIFSMGASIAISCKSMINRDKKLSEQLTKVLRRSLILFALGICLNSKWLANQGLDHLRLTGVLQRFAFSYLIVAAGHMIELNISGRVKAKSLSRILFLSHLLRSFMEIFTASTCLALYIYLTFYFEYDPDCPVGYLGPGGLTAGEQYMNCTGGAAGWIDRRLLGSSHLYNNRSLKLIFGTKLTLDPEGLLGFTMSILLTIIGLQAGKVMVYPKEHRKRLVSLIGWTLVLALASSSVLVVPINKHLWSLTFVTVSASLAYLLLSLLYILLDIYNCERLCLVKLLLSAGKNSIFLYVGHSVFTDMLPWSFKVDEFSRFQIFSRLCWTTLIWLLIAHFLAMKKIFVKV